MRHDVFLVATFPCFCRNAIFFSPKEKFSTWLFWCHAYYWTNTKYTIQFRHHLKHDVFWVATFPCLDRNANTGVPEQISQPDYFGVTPTIKPIEDIPFNPAIILNMMCFWLQRSLVWIAILIFFCIPQQISQTNYFGVTPNIESIEDTQFEADTIWKFSQKTNLLQSFNTVHSLKTISYYLIRKNGAKCETDYN